MRQTKTSKRVKARDADFFKTVVRSHLADRMEHRMSLHGGQSGDEVGVQFGGQVDLSNTCCCLRRRFAVASQSRANVYDACFGVPCTFYTIVRAYVQSQSFAPTKARSCQEGIQSPVLPVSVPNSLGDGLSTRYRGLLGLLIDHREVDEFVVPSAGVEFLALVVYGASNHQLHDGHHADNRRGRQSVRSQLGYQRLESIVVYVGEVSGAEERQNVRQTRLVLANGRRLDWISLAGLRRL